MKKCSFLPAALGAGLAAGAAFWFHKRKNEEEAPRSGAPAPVMKLERELVKRMSDMIYYDRFQLDRKSVV